MTLTRDAPPVSPGDEMDTHLTPITDFAEAIAEHHPEEFEAAVRTAYETGVSRDALLMAVDVVRAAAGVPAPLVTQAYAAVHRWFWNRPAEH